MALLQEGCVVVCGVVVEVTGGTIVVRTGGHALFGTSHWSAESVQLST